MKAQVLLALLPVLAMGQSSQQNYNDICPSQNGETTVIDGVTFKYHCDMRAKESEAGTSDRHDDPADCARRVLSTANTGVSWRGTNGRCDLATSGPPEPYNGRIYLEKIPDEEEDDSSSDIECFDNLDDCNDEKDQLKTQLDQCKKDLADAQEELEDCQDDLSNCGTNPPPATETPLRNCNQGQSPIDQYGGVRGGHNWRVACDTISIDPNSGITPPATVGSLDQCIQECNNREAQGCKAVVHLSGQASSNCRFYRSAGPGTGAGSHPGMNTAWKS